MGKLLLGMTVVAVGAALFFKEEIKRALRQSQLDFEAEIAASRAERIKADDKADPLDVVEAAARSVYADMKAAYNRL